MPNDFHLVHLGERALGGAGLVFTEMTCVSPEGRISPGCTGLWNDEQVAAWKKIVDFCHANSRAKICLQLGHSGAKGSTRLGWEGNDVPLDDGNWPVMAASAVRWSPVNQLPRAMTRADMDAVRDQFVAADAHGTRAAGSTWSSSTPPTAICCRASSRRCRTSAPTNMAGHSKTAFAIRSKSSPRCAPPGRRTGRCRCAFRQPTGRARMASHRPTRSRSARRSRAKARI